MLLPLREKLIERLKAESLVKCAQLEFECVMTVVDIELAGFFMHKDRWLEQLGIVEKRREELAEQLQEVLAEESSQGSLFGGPQRDDINLDSHQQFTQALIVSVFLFPTLQATGNFSHWQHSIQSSKLCLNIALFKRH